MGILALAQIALAETGPDAERGVVSSLDPNMSPLLGPLDAQQAKRTFACPGPESRLPVACFPANEDVARVFLPTPYR
jgi:hypothetical protein